MNLVKLSKKDWIIWFSVITLFIGLHLFGLRSPYHQDEYKWVLYSHPEIITPGTVPHPPLTEFIYTRLGPIVGDYNFRTIPFIFGFLNIFLLFYLVKYLYDKKTAYIAITIFTLSFYSLLASLMVDVDGAVMPFFFLILLIGYLKWKNSNFTFDYKNYKWMCLILIGAIGGFFIKISSVLPILAVFFDFIIFKKAFTDKKRVFKYTGYGLLGLVLLFVLLLLSKFIFPFFNFEYALKYWEHFIVWDRGWFQTIIQCIKAALFSSPFLILVPLFLTKEDFVKNRIFVFFLSFAFIFYIILFDFSIGALDRYLQLLVIPLTILSSVVISKILDTNDRRSKEFLLIGTIVSLILIMVQSLPHYVPPLHPKTEWVSRIISLKWNFLYPFSGGSGPVGFYVSFLFMALVWIIFICVVIFVIWKPQNKKRFILFLIPLGIVYNGMFIEEYLFGFYNGSAPRLIASSMEYIKNNPDIKMVTTYNDNAGFELQWIGKYRKRLYIDPKFDLNDKVANLNKYKEHYFVLDIPRIDPISPYQKYFDSCKIVYEKIDRSISAKVYDCRRAPDLKV
ncbi:MAG: hypothetical protein AB201_03395 [Parcubacteria bacterium C7867-006]|nr:MAG: hypothetical protein AB201_03395 [Parcubacteria bacterium C7867-006]